MAPGRQLQARIFAAACGLQGKFGNGFAFTFEKGIKCLLLLALIQMIRVFLFWGFLMIKKYLAGFSIYDLMIIAILSALGIAVGAVIGHFVRIFTGPLMIPGGAVAGGIYMLFLVLCVSLTGKKSAAVLCGFVQAIIVMILGVAGNHGAMTIITYTMPGIAIFLLFAAMRHKGCCGLCCFFGCMAANLTGTFLVGWGVMALPMVPMLLGLAIAALSGGLGGLLTWSLTKQLRKFGIV